MNRLLSLALVAALAACGHRPEVGVHVNVAGYAKTRLGASPPELPSRRYASANTLRRARQADVAGDSRTETLVEIGSGRGVEIRDAAGGVVGRLTTAHYLTDFAAIHPVAGSKAYVVLYMYPDQTRGGTFTVVDAEGRELVRWSEPTAPAGLTVASWKGGEAVFYLVRNSLVARRATGERLTRLPAPGASAMQRLHVRPLANEGLVAVASGSGYTPLHVVYVFDVGGQLVFSETADEHAFDLETDTIGQAFVVLTRSSRWRYATGQQPSR